MPDFCIAIIAPDSPTSRQQPSHAAEEGGGWDCGHAPDWSVKICDKVTPRRAAPRLLSA